MLDRAAVDREMAERLTAIGYELVECRHGGTARRPHLTVRIDRLDLEPGQQVTVDDCARASRALEAWLDQAGVGEGGRYILEVSSPGLDRPLKTTGDWQRFIGRPVDILAPTLGGRFRVTARGVQEAPVPAVEVEFPNGSIRVLPLTDIKEARLGFDW